MALPKDATGKSPYYGSSGLMPRPALDRTRRTNTRLIRGPQVDIVPTSGLVVASSPIVDKSFTYPYTQDYNTASQGLNLIPKGHVIAFNNAGEVDYSDFDSANQNVYPIGLNYLNQFKPVADRLAGNRPGVAIRGFFELPIFASYADAAAVDHRWGAILARNGSILPGDLLRFCGSQTDGAKAPGWFTNANANNSGKLTPKTGAQDKGIIAQVYEVDMGPTFEGLLEWVQPEDPSEFEDSFDFWTTGDANKKVYRDPNSPTGFSYDNNGYQAIWPGPDFPHGQPALQEQPWKDAAGIPALSDGANWRTYQEDTIGGFDATSTQQSVTFFFYYHVYAGVGLALKRDASGALDAAADIADVAAATGGNTLTDWVQSIAANAVVDSFVNDGQGTIAVTYTGTDIAGKTFPAKKMYFLAKGQVAGVPVMIDVARCIGLARFQLFIR